MRCAVVSRCGRGISNQYPGAGIKPGVRRARRVNSLVFEVMMGTRGAIGIKAGVDEAVNILEELSAPADRWNGQSLVGLRSPIEPDV